MNAKKYMKKQKISIFTIVLHIFFVLVTLCYIFPIVMVVAASFSDEQALRLEGVGLLPRQFTTLAYQSAFGNGTKMLQAYWVTFSQAFLGTVLGCVVAGMAGYALSRSNFRFKKMVTGFIFFTMLFNAGMVPTYIVLARYYGLNDSYWVYILPGLAGGAWNTMVFRTFFRGIPESLFESARIDGAKELTVYFKIVIPLSTPVYASLGFMMLVNKWNNYTTSMIYIRNEKLYTLQFLLQRLMNESDYLKKLMADGVVKMALDTSKIPGDTLKYAMCVIAAGPMLVVFPFFQKYFSQGLTIGAVKG